MPHAIATPPRTIETHINYRLAPPNGEVEGPIFFRTAAYRRKKYNPQPVRVTDVRSCEDEFKLDVHGFAFVDDFNVPSESFIDDGTIRAEAYPLAQDLLMKKTGATHVYVFNHILRREAHQKVLDLPKDIPDDENVDLETPAMFAHVDQSYRGADGLLNGIPEAEEYIPKSKSRWGVINIWVPLKEVNREPLAVCDNRSVPESDLHEITYRSQYQDPPGKKGLYQKDAYLWQPKANSEHRWYYKSQMAPGDAILIKCFDTKMDGRARNTIHTAISTPEDHGPARESVEIRCIVFWEDDPLQGEEKQFISTARDDWVRV